MMQYLELTVANLKRNAPVNLIQSKLLELEEVFSVEVDVERGQVRLKGGALDANQIAETLASMDYPLRNKRRSVFSKAKTYIHSAIGRTK